MCIYVCFSCDFSTVARLNENLLDSGTEYYSNLQKVDIAFPYRKKNFKTIHYIFYLREKFKYLTYLTFIKL